MTTETASDPNLKEWMDAKKVIKTMLRELRPECNEATHDHNAAAIIARLVSHEPPLHIVYESRVKWD